MACFTINCTEENFWDGYHRATLDAGCVLLGLMPHVAMVAFGGFKPWSLLRCDEWASGGCEVLGLSFLLVIVLAVVVQNGAALESAARTYLPHKFSSGKPTIKPQAKNSQHKTVFA